MQISDGEFPEKPTRKKDVTALYTVVSALDEGEAVMKDGFPREACKIAGMGGNVEMCGLTFVVYRDGKVGDDGKTPCDAGKR